MAEYLFQGTLDNTVQDISYEQIKQLYEDNRREEAEGRRITQSSYRGVTPLLSKHNCRTATTGNVYSGRYEAYYLVK